ncbi:MAG TPA: DUF2784 domain-containing protein [Vicinamibacterales bacterium]|nr:DUF2784 domain-containing protein [Vicinamibacterales bacterium]
MNALLADFIVLVHVAFVGFVALGGLLVLRWPRLAWAHLPAVAWGAVIEFSGWICPLTPLENELRTRDGAAPYVGDFVARYLMPLLYPEGLTRSAQLGLGALVVIVNAAIYVQIMRRRRMHRA